MLDLERSHLVSVVADGRGPVQLDQLERIRDVAHDPPQRDEELLEAGRAEDAKRSLAPVQLVGLEQAGHAQVVVGVVVRDVEVVDLDEPGRALHLALGALAAVDEDAIPAGTHEQARRRPPCRRHRASGAEKDNVKVHAASVTATRGACALRRPLSGSGRTHAVEDRPRA